MIPNNIFDTIYKVSHAGGSGSCFYLKAYGVFVTNYHVVEGFKRVSIEDNLKNSYIADVVVVNPAVDIALLKIEEELKSVPDIVISNEEILQIGQKIYVAGYPFGMPFTVTSGSVTSPKQLLDGAYFIQTDAAVNPGNSGGPMFNDSGELVAITVSKFNEADNMGFGIPVSELENILDSIKDKDINKFNVQCSSCDLLIDEKSEFCPQCGIRLPEDAFSERMLTELAKFCEESIEAMGINPIQARVGYESWRFHKGSAEIRMYMYMDAYLFCESPINILPRNDLEPILNYILKSDVKPFKMGIDSTNIFLVYRVHVTDIFSKYREEIKKNIVNLAEMADQQDSYIRYYYGLDMSKYSKK